MESLYLLIPLALIVVVGAAVLFLAAAAGGQFEGLQQQQRELPDED